MIFATTSISRTINLPEGRRDCLFWPISLGLFMRTRSLIKPLLQAFALFTAGGANDTGREMVNVDHKGEGTQQRTTVQPITDTLARTRAEQKAKAIDLAIDNLMSEASMKTIAEIVQDSMREEWGKKRGRDAAALQAFVDDVPMEIVIELLAGVAEANKKLFDPFLQRLKGLGQIFSLVADRMADDLKPTDEPEGGPPNGPQLVKTETASGQS